MFASLSDENRIKAIMKRLEVSTPFVSALAVRDGVPKASLPVLRDGLSRGLRSETSQPLLRLLQRLDTLVSQFHPVKIQLVNATEVFDWLVLFESGRLKLWVDEVDAVPNEVVVIGR